MKISMEFVNEFGTTTKLTKEIDDFETSEIDFFEKFVNVFLNAAGYYDFTKDRVPLWSVTEEEYESLSCLLNDMREDKKHDA